MLVHGGGRAGREAGCFKEVAALYSDHYGQFPLYNL